MATTKSQPSNLPPELEAQARELAQAIATHEQFKFSGQRLPAEVLEDFVREMAQRTLGWAVRQSCHLYHDDPSKCPGEGLRSLAGQEERDGK